MAWIVLPPALTCVDGVGRKRDFRRPESIWLRGFVGFRDGRGLNPLSLLSMGSHSVFSIEVVLMSRGRVWDGSELVGVHHEKSNSSDIVIASNKASFALPEVKRGVFAKAGALGRIIRFLGNEVWFKVDETGLQRASEMALIGDPISPQKMHEWGVVNAIVPHDELMPTALKWARKICQNSPDAVIVSRTGMLSSLERIFLGLYLTLMR
jgi:hypothetical protein